LFFMEHVFPYFKKAIQIIYVPFCATKVLSLQFATLISAEKINGVG